LQLTFEVNEQTIKRTDTKKVVADSKNYLTAYFTFSTEMLLNGVDMNRFVNFKFSSESATSDGKKHFFEAHRDETNNIIVRSNGILRTVDIPLDDWFKLDLVLNVRNKTYSAYINGNIFVQNETFSLNNDFEITQIAEFQLGLNQMWDTTEGKFGVTNPAVISDHADGPGYGGG
jgi:hypothetical protein